MGSLVLVLVIALVVGALIFGVLALLSGDDPGLVPAEPDHALPLPASRPLTENDLGGVRFDVALRGYRMAQVDRALRRAAYDIGYKDEMIAVLEAEINALRDGRAEDAELMRKARENALAGVDRGYTVPEEAGGDPVEAEVLDTDADPVEAEVLDTDAEPAETELADAAVVEAEEAGAVVTTEQSDDPETAAATDAEDTGDAGGTTRAKSGARSARA